MIRPLKHFGLTAITKYETMPLITLLPLTTKQSVWPSKSKLEGFMFIHNPQVLSPSSGALSGLNSVSRLSLSAVHLQYGSFLITSDLPVAPDLLHSTL